MPLYTYKCKPNDHIFEVKQSFDDEPLQTCPECGGEVRKVINSVGVVFKGSGFYITDTRDGKNSTNGSSSTKSEDKTETNTSTSSKTESKETTTTKSDTTKKTETKVKSKSDS